MSLNSEKENSINWFNRESRIEFSLNQLKLKNKIKKLIEEGDTEIKIYQENPDGTMIGSMPLNYLKISKPYKRNLSDDQRKAIAQRFYGPEGHKTTDTCDSSDK